MGFSHVRGGGEEGASGGDLEGPERESCSFRGPKLAPAPLGLHMRSEPLLLLKRRAGALTLDRCCRCSRISDVLP
eukprot:6962082-Pyramimonas_sp.AAC.1